MASEHNLEDEDQTDSRSRMPIIIVILAGHNLVCETVEGSIGNRDARVEDNLLELSVERQL